MAYNRISRFKNYLDMEPVARMKLAVATGETTAVGLTRKDSVLVKVLRYYDEMTSFLLQRRNFGRGAHYSTLSEKQLIALAVGISKKKGFEFMRQLQQIDSPLYNRLRECQLTAKVADQAGFRGNRRRASGKVRNRRVPTETRQSLYAGMTDDALLEAIRETKVIGSKNLNELDSVLYTEVMCRPVVRRRLVTLGWRRESLRWEDMGLNEWVGLCGQFDTKASFRRDYTAGYAYALKSGLWGNICETLNQQGKWKSLCGFDGLKYQSRAECIVANWLYISNVSYKPHPMLPLKNSRRSYQADFGLLEFPVWVEVFLCSTDGLIGRSDAPSWAPEYICKRKLKEDYYASDPEKRLLTIEAEIHRYDGLNAYLTHILERFAQFGIELVDPDHIRLELSNDQRGMFWTLEEFLDYAKTQKFTKLSDFANEGHRDLYAVLASRAMRDELRQALAKKNGKHISATKKSQLTLDELRVVCQNLNISTKTQYQEAHKARQLPIGAPSCIRQNYGINWAVFFKGKGWSEFWPWEKSREYTRSRKFQNREQFHQAVRTDPDMKYIRRNPGNHTSGGYPDFTDWYDFLGKSRPMLIAHKVG